MNKISSYETQYRIFLTEGSKEREVEEINIPSISETSAQILLKMGYKDGISHSLNNRVKTYKKTVEALRDKHNNPTREKLLNVLRIALVISLTALTIITSGAAFVLVLFPPIYHFIFNTESNLKEEIRTHKETIQTSTAKLYDFLFDRFESVSQVINDKIKEVTEELNKAKSKGQDLFVNEKSKELDALNHTLKELTKANDQYMKQTNFWQLQSNPKSYSVQAALFQEGQDNLSQKMTVIEA